jgi:hypothetical protein
MGLYINPVNETKEEFLNREGTPAQPEWPSDPDKVLVCWIENQMFTAAAVIFDHDELREFTQPDTRPRLWYTVPKQSLSEVCQGQEKRYFPELR